MKHPTTVTVEQFFKETSKPLELTLVSSRTGFKRLIREPTVNRPGLAMAGFTRYFASKRVQVIGNAESHFLKTLSKEKREATYTKLFTYKVPCYIFSRDLTPDDTFLEFAEKAGIPVMMSPLITMKLINRATLALEMMFAPKGSEMGSMVDILGVGVIIRGESGIGKSECVLALIERGYSLVADDMTKVALVDGKDIVGTSVDMARGFMEIRGIGIVDISAMFGVKSIRKEKRVDMVVTLKEWSHVKHIERLGLDQEHVRILGMEVVHITIPVRPGRDLARLIEVAAFQAKLKMSGYNSAKAFNDRLISLMTEEREG